MDLQAWTQKGTDGTVGVTVKKGWSGGGDIGRETGREEGSMGMW